MTDETAQDRLGAKKRAMPKIVECGMNNKIIQWDVFSLRDRMTACSHNGKLLSIQDVTASIHNLGHVIDPNQTYVGEPLNPKRFGSKPNVAGQYGLPLFLDDLKDNTPTRHPKDNNMVPGPYKHYQYNECN